MVQRLCETCGFQAEVQSKGGVYDENDEAIEKDNVTGTRIGESQIEKPQTRSTNASDARGNQVRLPCRFTNFHSLRNESLLISKQASSEHDIRPIVGLGSPMSKRPTYVQVPKHRKHDCRRLKTSTESIPDENVETCICSLNTEQAWTTSKL